MRELPDQRTMNELLELAKDAYDKAKVMYDTATEIAEKKEQREGAMPASGRETPRR